MALTGAHQLNDTGRLADDNARDSAINNHGTRLTSAETTLSNKQDISAKGQANGYASLDSGGKVPSGQVPAIAINNVFQVANQAAMLALSASPGDIAFRSDVTTGYYQLTASPASTLGNWVLRTFVGSGVSSINGTLTGAVTGIETITNKGSANGYAPLDANSLIPSANIPSAASVVSHVNEYHKFDIRRYVPTNAGTNGSDCTAGIIAAMADVQASSTPGVFYQNGTTGAFQGSTNVANGGGEIFVPVGTFYTGNFTLASRVGIHGEGYGSILKRLAGTSGDWILNRRDTSVHAKYSKISNIALHGNRVNQTSTGTAVRYLGETGTDSAAFKNPLDEDYDENHTMNHVYIYEVKGDGVRCEGSGENRLSDIHVHHVDGLGVYLWQDNWLINSSISWTGTYGVRVDGDSVILDSVKAWYSGRTTPANGAGFYITSDVGIMSGCSTQDTAAQGVLFDGANNWTVQINVDSASMSSSGTYPGIDIYNSTYINIQGNVRNRYRNDGSFGPCKDGLNHAGGSAHNFGDIVVGQSIWGVQNKTKSGSSAGTETVLRVNGVAIT